MKFNVMDLEDILDEEVESYGIMNSLDDFTVEELHFIAGSFAKFFKNEYSKDSNISKIIKEFEGSLKVLTTGVFGRSFTTNAVLLYRSLPSINEIYQEGIKQLESQIENLADSNHSLRTENISLKKEVDILKRDLEDVKEKLKKHYRNEPTIRTTTGTSYGGCGGGSRSYGSC